MQRSAYTLKIREGMEEQYRQTHCNVWPELIEAASRCGVRNHSSFVNGRTVFVYIEADNLPDTYARLGKEPVNVRWDQVMGSILEPDNLLFEEVFHMD
jgi:L-rhamnose mutarotase